MKLEALQFPLPTLKLGGKAPEYGLPIGDYFQYYGIDFEHHIPDLNHYFGAVESEPYTLACHYYRLNKPADDGDDTERQTLLIVHGYYDHSGLYKHAILNALQQGCDVVIFDLPGHGLSSGERTHINSFNDYQRALKAIIKTFKAEHIAITALMGQSTGAAIITQYLLESPNQQARVILLAPLYKPSNWRRTALLHGAVKAWLPRVPRGFANNTHDKNFIQFLKKRDPLQSKVTSIAWVGALKEWIDNFKYFKASKQSVLIVQGTHDDTVDWRSNLSVLQKKIPNATIKYIECAGHQLVNESEAIREQLFDIINPTMTG